MVSIVPPPANLSSPSTPPSPASLGPSMALGASISPLPLTNTVALTFSSPPPIGLSRACETLSHFPDPVFPFEDPTLLPSVPNLTASRPSPTFEGSNLVGRRFLDPDLGPSLITGPGPGPQTFLQPHTGNLGDGTPLAPGWPPTLTLSPIALPPLTLPSPKSLTGCPSTRVQPLPHFISSLPSPARHPIPARTAGVLQVSWLLCLP
jgi:hypothetical protein